MSCSCGCASRLEKFTAEELTLLSAGLSELITSTLDAARWPMSAEHRTSAAATLLFAAMVSFEIDEHVGTPHPPIEDFHATATAIADGSFATTIAIALAEAGSPEVSS